MCSKFSSKNIRVKIRFTQTKLNENNFTSCLWWALIEEIEPRAEEVACKNMMACCVEDYHVYDIWAAAIGEMLVCSREPTNEGKNFAAKLNYFRMFSVYENIYKKKKKMNYCNIPLTYHITCSVGI